MTEVLTSPILLPEAYRKTVVPGVYSVKLGAPLAAQYEITGGCNYACRFCYNVWKGEDAVRPPRPVTAPDRKRIVRRIIEWGVFDLIFSGGEPLLDRELPTLVGLAERNGVETSLITNGALLSVAYCAALHDAGLRSVQISLHAADPQKNDRITQTRGSHWRTVNGIRNAVAVFGGECINVNMVLTSENCREVCDTARLVSELGPLQFSVGTLSETGAAITSDQVLTRSQFQFAYCELTRARQETGLAVGVSGGFPLCILAEITNDPLELVSNYCDAGLNQVVIAPNGDLRACVCYPHLLGNILRDDPRRVWETAEFLAVLRNLEHVPPSCYGCKYVALCKGGCRAAAFATYHDLKAPDPLGERR